MFISFPTESSIDTYSTLIITWLHWWPHYCCFMFIVHHHSLSHSVNVIYLDHITNASVNKAITDSDNGLSLVWHQAIIRTNASMQPIPACEVCIHWRKSIAACKIQCQCLSRQLAESRWSHQTTLFQGPWRDPVGMHKALAYVRSHVGLETVQHTPFYTSHTYYKEAKAMQINRSLKSS